MVQVVFCKNSLLSKQAQPAKLMIMLITHEMTAVTKSGCLPCGSVNVDISQPS